MKLKDKQTKRRKEDVLTEAMKFYGDFFPEQHPFEMADQPAIVQEFKDEITGLDPMPEKKQITIPDESILNPGYIKLTLGL